MGLNYSPSIVLDGLILCWDAANVRSYPGSGASVSDISRSGHTLSLTASPSFSANNGGGIVFNGSTQYGSIVDTANVRFPHNQSWTFEIVLTPISWVNTFPLIIQKGDAAAAGIILFYYSDNNLYWKHNNVQTIVGTWAAATPMIFTITYDTTTVRFYQNGVVHANTSTMASTDSTSVLYCAGTIAANYTLHQIKKYNRPLSSEEIVKNFNAIRGRFNL